MATRINDRQIKALIRKGEAGRYAVGNGLYLRISDEGTSSWAVRYTIHRKRREITIGNYPALSLANAAAQTVLLKAGVKEGIDPLSERAREDSIEIKTVDQLAEDWLRECDRRLKHPAIPRRVYRKELSPVLGGISLRHVTPRDIRVAINRICESKRPTIANDALMYCKQLFNHGIKLDLMVNNPAIAFTMKDAGGVEKSRDRALLVEELSLVFKALNEFSDQFSRENYLNIALLLVLSVRKGELIAAQWDEFDFDKKCWVLPASRAKTSKEIKIPLTDEAISWLNELQIRACGAAYVFPNRRSSKRFSHTSPDTLNAAINKLFNENKLSIAHFTVHDLRRTSRSLMAQSGVPAHVAERCLNHTLRGVEGVYDRYDYYDERLDAQQRIVSLIAPLINIHDPKNGPAS